MFAARCRFAPGSRFSRVWGAQRAPVLRRHLVEMLHEALDVLFVARGIVLLLQLHQARAGPLHVRALRVLGRRRIRSEVHGFHLFAFFDIRVQLHKIFFLEDIPPFSSFRVHGRRTHGSDVLHLISDEGVLLGERDVLDVHREEAHGVVGAAHHHDARAYGQRQNGLVQAAVLRGLLPKRHVRDARPGRDVAGVGARRGRRRRRRGNRQRREHPRAHLNGALWDAFYTGCKHSNMYTHRIRLVHDVHLCRLQQNEAPLVAVTLPALCFLRLGSAPLTRKRVRGIRRHVHAQVHHRIV
mmetsp:Transcript_40730/g.77781  ORF Transcript_40730/g.77781 Transcript_40730/m.77781 type:complete len:297 (-) Transcript_40730:255-1145(-)